jgi:hypothetical protein
LGQYQKKIFRVSVPDVADIFYAPVRRSFFVNRDHAYGFTTGVLTNSTVDHPSEVLGLLSIPVAILNGVSQAITGRFGAKTVSLTNETALRNAEAANINAQKALLDAQKSLDDATKSR